ncbi:MAG: extracellular solute-binding protein [Clostridiales bacterium]|nr:extracellular solute-binding protein [Clostridiales bacterium]
MKKILSMVFMLVLALSLVTIPAVGEEQITLSFLSWQTETTLGPIIEAFEAEYPNIKIDFQYAPPVGDYVEKFRVLVAANELPDVFVTAAENKQEVMDHNMALDLSEFAVVERLGAANRNTYTDENGKLVGIAPDAWIAGVFYNAKMLADNGIEVPTNHQEFVDSFAKLKEAEIQPWVFHSGNLYDPLQGYVATETVANNVDFDKEANKGEKTYVEGWTKPLELWDQYYVQNEIIPEEALGMDADQADNAFINEEVCYTIGATWSVSNIDEKNPDLQYGMLPWFGVENTEDTWCTGAAGVSWSINANTKHPEEAKLFLEFLTRDDMLLLFQQETGGLLGVSGIDYDMHPVIAMCKEELEAGRFYLPAVEWKHSGALGEILRVGTQEVVMGVRDTASIAVSMDEKAVELDAAAQ